MKRERGREVERIRAREHFIWSGGNQFLLCMLGVGVSYQNEISNNCGLSEGPDLLKEMQ